MPPPGGSGQWWRRGQLTGRWWRPLPAGTGRTPPVLHRTIGFVVVAPMVLVAVTGIRLALPAGSDRIWAAVTGSGEGRYDTPPEAVAVTSDDRGGAPLDATQMLEALERRYPDGRVARLLMPDEGDRMAPVLAGVSLGLDPGRGEHDYGGNAVVFLDQFSAATLWEGRPDSVPGRPPGRPAVGAAPAHRGGGRLGRAGSSGGGWPSPSWRSPWRATATRRVRTLAVRLEAPPGAAPAEAAEGAGPAAAGPGSPGGPGPSPHGPPAPPPPQRPGPHRGRCLERRPARRRRRTDTGMPVDLPAIAADRPIEIGFTDTERPPVDIDLTDTAQRPAVDIDLTGPAGAAAPEIDLTDSVVYESEITLESGDTLETGIVGSAAARTGRRPPPTLLIEMPEAPLPTANPAPAGLDDDGLARLYRALLLPRLVEEKMLRLLRQGRLSKWFSGIGQEAIAVGVVHALDSDDLVLPMHRNLGVFTSRGVDLDRLLRQLLGREGGFTAGRDRSFHFGTLRARHRRDDQPPRRHAPGGRRPRPGRPAAG